MWSRSVVFVFFCVVSAGCTADKESEYVGGDDRSQSSPSPIVRDGNFERKAQSGFNGSNAAFMSEGSSSDSERGYNHREVTTSRYDSVTGNRPGYREDYSTGRPAGTHNRPMQPGYEGVPADRPLESSTVNREGNNRPGSGNEPFPNRPLGSSFPTSGMPTEGGTVRPAGFNPDSNGQHSFGGRPTGEFIATTSSQPAGGSSYGQEGGHSPFDSQPDQFTTEPNEQNVNSNDKETGNDKNDGKEEDKDVCFPNLGCFKMGKPWKSILRPIGAPYGPEKIQTTIHYYSRESLEKQKNITLYPQINMGEARFDPSKITAIIVHGFSNSGNATWMKDMKNVYLSKVNANVMIVDWGKGAQLLNYLQVAGNTRVVGKQLGLFVKYLIENYGADPGKFHLIGHSLGAQICSYLAKEVPGMARLTALDPAQPGFEGFDSELRLDKTDAEFVDVIHTDARPFIPTLGFGMITPHGHVDFYMNGGFDQPGCIPPAKKELPSVKNFLDLAKYPVEVIAKTVACPHGRAYEYLIEAFNETEKCIFWGHKADVKNVFKSVTNTVTQGLLKKFTALSTTCSKEDCIPVGFATKKSPLRGVFVVTTASRSPYCISEPGIPPETPPQDRKQESFIQKIGKKTGLRG